MELRSDAFESGEEIPRRFTCEGDDVSPPLRWNGVPAGTRALALICEDPDAPLKTFAHWIVYNLPAAQTSLAANLPKEAELTAGAKQGKNSFGRLGYGGPCPPNGPFHRYYFTLYALDQPLPLAGGATKRKVERAMDGHVMAKAQTMGRYRRVPLRTFVRALIGR